MISRDRTGPTPAETARPASPGPTARPGLPGGLHRDDRDAAEALLALAARRRDFSAVLVARVAGEQEEATGHLHIRSGATGPTVEWRESETGTGMLRDPLTDLATTDLVLDRIGQALAGAERDRQPVAVAVVALDGFDVLDDAFGGHGADEVLVWTAGRLRRELRPTDTVGRLGRDRFVVVAAGLPDPGRADALADRLRRAVGDATIRPVDGLTACVGVTVAPPTPTAAQASPDDAAPTARTLVEEALAALDAAKAEGPDRIRTFDAPLAAERQARRALAGRLHQALADGELRVHFQPIHDLVAGHAVAVEALVHLVGADGHRIDADGVLGAARARSLTGLTEQVVLDDACATVAAWHRDGLDLELSVNIAGHHLGDEATAMNVARAVHASGLDPARLTLEIAEADLADDPDRARSAIARLRSLGVRIAVDNFGGSVIVLAALPDLGVHEVKLARPLVAALDTHWGRTVLATTVERARALQLQVTAVGVEHPAQRDALATMGCRRAQGFLLGRPAAAAELRAHLEATGNVPTATTGIDADV